MFALFDPSVFRLNSMAAAPTLKRTDSARGELSPLKHFVVAKKKISDVFEQLLNYVNETSEFVEGEKVCLSVVFTICQSASMGTHGSKIIFNEKL